MRSQNYWSENITDQESPSLNSMADVTFVYSGLLRRGYVLGLSDFIEAQWGETISRHSQSKYEMGVM